MTAKAALFLVLPTLASAQAVLTAWTHSEDPGSGMLAREIAFARKDRLRDAVATLHAIAKTEKISPDSASQSITVEGNAREASLAEWLIGELDNPSPSQFGHGYIMPQDQDDVTLVVGDVHLGGPGRAATPQDLRELVNAIHVLGDIPRAAVYSPADLLVWRGKVWQNDFALWLLQELASPLGANWTAPIPHHLDQALPSVRVFYFAPETSVQDLGQILSTIRAKAPVQRVVAINAKRAIVLRGTEIQAAAAERIAAAARH